jgi:glycosyltransferase involved in cell wall biosynthesis
MRKGITVIICTFNGADRLTKTIEHIARQTFSVDVKWEVILADNGSTDGSREIALINWNRHSLSKVPLRVIVESKAGKIYALQHAIQQATYEYLVICDDDNWLSSEYLETAYKLLEAMPEIGAIGGYGIPVTNGMQLPEWLSFCVRRWSTRPQNWTP